MRLLIGLSIFAFLIALIGAIWRTALSWLAVERLGDLAGIVPAVLVGAGFIGSLTGAWWFPRLELRTRVLAIGIPFAVGIGGVGIASAHPALGLLLLLACVFVAAGAGVLFDPAVQQSISAYVDTPVRMQRMTGATEFTGSIGRAVGPAAIGALILWAPLTATFWICAGLVALAVVSVWLAIGDRQPVAISAAPRRRLFEFHLLRGRPLEQYLTFGHGLYNFGWYTGLLVGLPLLLKESGAADAGLYARIMTVYGLAAILGAGVSGFIPDDRPAFIFALARGLPGLGFVGMSFAQSEPMLYASAAVVGGFGPLGKVASVGLFRMGRSPDQVAGLVRLRLASEMAFALAGLLVSTVTLSYLPTRVTIFICGAAGAAVGLYGIIRFGIGRMRA